MNKKAFYSYLLLGIFIVLSCQNESPYGGARFVNGTYDEVLTAFPSLEPKYTFNDSSISEVGKKSYHHQVYKKGLTETPFSGTLTNTHWNDSLKAQATFIDGKVQSFTTYYSNGQKKKEVTLQKRGKQKDFFGMRTWYYTGELESVRKKNESKYYYKNGQLKAERDSTSTTEYWKNGNKQSYWPFENGRVGSEYHGTWKAWHQNGQLAIEGYYKNGEKSGQWVYYDSLGNKKKTELYNLGELERNIKHQ